MRKSIVLAGITALSLAPLAMGQATVDLRVTEIWAGVGGPDHTLDWFELTNFSDSVSYPLNTYFVNDNSGGTGSARLMQGVASIAPGESVIFLMEGTAIDTDTFRTVWNLVGSPVQVGYADGSGLGLGAGGDAVNVYTGDTGSDTLVTGQSYPAFDDSNYASFVWNNDLNAWDDSRAVAGVWGAYNSTVSAGDSNAPAVGSPGVAIPAPGALTLACAAGLVGLRRRR